MDTAILSAHGLLNHVPSHALDSLAGQCRGVTLAAGEVLLTPGEENHTLYFLLSGRLQVHLDARDSKNSFSIQPGEIIGEMSIIEHRPVVAWVVAMEPSTLLAMPESVFWNEFITIPQATRRLLQLLIRRVRKTDQVLRQELEQKVRYELLQRELESAGKIQAGILPSVNPFFPQHPRVDAHAIIRPAREVGGDFYDAGSINEHCLYVAVGDVSGKGMPAALFMVRVLTLLRVCLLREATPESVLPAVNRLLCEANDEMMFVSLAVAVLDTLTGQMTYLNAGHNPPLLSTGGRPFELWIPPEGVLLGIQPAAEFPVARRRFDAGDALVLYTDGVTEACNPGRELFCVERAASALNACNPGAGLGDLVQGLEQELARHRGAAPPSDDVAVMALRYNGPPGMRE